ncbi:hypothetical protein M9Y10_042241 [Tritrichomonas musculus]|uniref:DnaJ domain containing protein n=1 Tax=Tritrichomonas musculus TaxID=1915356 RepID=A0ABR2K786_9EUKA
MSEESDDRYESSHPKKVQSLYDILGCSPTATQEEIKKAYRKKAFQLHPDRNKNDPHATEEFQQLGQAYSILKDPAQRAEYDRSRENRSKTSSNNSDSDFQENVEVKKQTIDIMTQIYGFGKYRAPPTGPKMSPTYRLIRVPMKVAYLGGDINEKIEIAVVCPSCKGTGSKDGKKYPICDACNGTGGYFKGDDYSYFYPCEKCHKIGFLIPKGKACKKCHGHKVIIEKKKMQIPIEQGADNLDQIEIPDKGDEYPGKDPADLNLLILIQNQGGFVRCDNDLFHVCYISNIEMKNGTSFELKSLDGRTLKLHTPPKQHVDCNRFYKVQGEGFPIKGNPSQKGNLYIKFNQPQGGISGAIFCPLVELGRATGSAIIKSVDKNKSHMINTISEDEQEKILERLRKQNEDLNDVDDPAMDVFNNLIFFVPIPV